MELNGLSNSFITREEFRDFKGEVRDLRVKVDELPEKVTKIVSEAIQPLVDLQRQQNGRVGKLEDINKDRAAKEKAITWLFRGVWGVIGAVVLKIFSGLF